MKNVYKLFSLAALLALTSCGGGGGNTSSSAESKSGSSAETSSSAATTSADASSSTESLPDVKEVDITFWTPFGQTPLEATQKKAKDFSAIIKKETGVTVNIDVSYQGQYKDLLEKISKGFATANVPTMAVAYPDHVATYLGKSPDYVYDIDPFFDDPNIGFGTQKYLGDSAEYDEEDILEAYLDEGRHYSKEGTYSYPLMKSSEVLYYNRDAVETIMGLIPDGFLPNASRSSAAAFVESLSWDDLIEVARYALEHKNQILDTITVPIWYDSDSNLFISKMYQEEIDFTSITAEGVGHIEFETGEARTATEDMVNSLAAAAKDGLLTTKGVKGTYGSDAFTRGECIFEVGSSGGAGYTAPSGEAFTFDVAAVPASNNNPLYISQGPDIAFIRNPGVSDSLNAIRARYAWQFAKYLTNPESNVYLCVYGSEGYVPVRYSAYETAEYNEFLREGETIAATAKVLLNSIQGNFLTTDTFIGSAELRDQVGGVLTQVFNGTKDAKTAIDDAIAYTKTYIK